MSSAPTLPSGEDSLHLDLEDYLKWRAKNSHIGVPYVDPDYPQIFVPSSVKDDECGQKVCTENEPLDENMSHIE